MTILVVDTVPIYRYGLVTFLKHRFADALILESDSVISFISNDPDETVDLIVARADSAVGNNDSNGSDVLTARELYPAAKIVVFGGTTEYEVVIANLNAGVSGYFSDGGELEEFVRCIEGVAEGKKYVSPDVLWILLDLRPTRKVPATRRALALTAHEHKIAEYYCEGKRTKWIAAQLCRKVSTISTIKASIFRKLKVDSVFQLKIKLHMQEAAPGNPQRKAAEGTSEEIGHW